MNRILSYLEEDKLAELRNHLIPRQKDMIRLCHNDLNNLNIMITKDRTYLIDYEYSKYNFIAYDIANFLSEGSINYTKESYPYFEFLDDLLPTDKFVEWACEVYLGYSLGVEKPDPVTVKNLADDVERCFALCNFYWALWSPMTKNPQIFFGYLEHGLKRLERFEATLEKIVSRQE